MVTKRGICLLLILFITAVMLITACTAQYAITTSVSPGDAGTVSPAGGIYDEDSEVTITAEPSPGYRFDRWSDEAMGTSNPATITMDSDKSFTAYFTAQHALTISVNPEGAGTVSPGSGNYDKDAKLTLTAEPAPGYRFDHWSGGAIGTSNPATITMNGDKSFTAYFTAQYSLSTSVSPEGAGVVSPVYGTYDEGTEVTLAITGDVGYIFDHWSGDASGTSSSVTITMDRAKSVTANFREGYTVGSLVSGDVWEIQVVSVEKETNGANLMGWERLAKAGYYFFVVEVQYRNLSSETQWSHSRNITLTDSNNRVYACTDSGSSGFSWFRRSFEITVPPSSDFSTVQIAFEVPDYAEGFYFSFEDLPEIYLGQ